MVVSNKKSRPYVSGFFYINITFKKRAGVVGGGFRKLAPSFVLALFANSKSRKQTIMI